MISYSDISDYLSDEQTPVYVPTFGPVVALILVTPLLNDVLSCIVMLLSLFPYYFITSRLQARYFSCTRTVAHLQLVFPLYTLVTFWSFMFVLSGRVDFLLGCIGPYIFVLLTAIWPIYRNNIERTKRRIPYMYSYGFASIFFVLSVSSFLWRMP